MNPDFLIHQFEDKSFAHYAYAVISGSEMILIDPARNPQPYYDFAIQQNVKISGVIETHPHADFVSSHVEISETTGATIYVSKLVGAAYPHRSFDEGDTIQLGSIKLRALNTPGHSPDSICVLLQSSQKDIAVFTGDTLFIGDCGRPDLRENAGNITATRSDLANSMYHSLRNKLLPLNNDVLVYPAHGAGTLCGKGLSDANVSTIGAEKISNWSLQKYAVQDFVNELISDQPFIPKYFEFDVATNKNGASNFLHSINCVPMLKQITCESFSSKIEKDILIIDTRQKKQFAESHFPNSINLQIGTKFETWLGSIVSPNEPFYLTATTESKSKELVQRIAKIGYEAQIKALFTATFCKINNPILDVPNFANNQANFTIVDIRTTSEVKEKQIFAHAINIPLAQLRERVGEIPVGKPILVHCAGGYRSAAGTSIIKNAFEDSIVYDLSEAVTMFLK